MPDRQESDNWTGLPGRFRREFTMLRIMAMELHREGSNNDPIAGRRDAGSAILSRGQAAVEFALVLGIALIVLFVSVQLALIGQVDLALGQMNYQGARYAAIYPACTDADATPCGPNNLTIEQYMLSVASPTITNLVNKDPSALTVSYSWTSTNGNSVRGFGDTVTIGCQLNISGILFLPSKFLGVGFPTTLNSQESAWTE